MNEAAMFNLIGLLKRAWPLGDERTIQVAGWIVYFLSIIIFSFLWWRQKKVNTNLLGITILASIFAAPHLHYHDLGLILFALFFYIKSTQIHQSAWVLAATSVLLLFGKAIPILEYTLPYLILFSTALLLFLLDAFPNNFMRMKGGVRAK